MRKIKLYIAVSLNGKIAESDGSVDWLETVPKPEDSDYGYSEFYKSIDTTIQGYSTYKQVLDWGIDFPYAEKKNYVITRKQDLKPTKHVEFLSKDPIAFVKTLKAQKGKDIWLIGGGQINTMLLNEKLIDEIHLFIMPIVIQNGIELFAGLPKETHLKLKDIKTYSSGAVQQQYIVE